MKKFLCIAILIGFIAIPAVMTPAPAQAVTTESFLNKTVMTPFRLMDTTFRDILCLGVIRNGQAFAKDKTDPAKTWTIYKFSWLTPAQSAIRVLEGSVDVITAPFTEAVYVEPAEKNNPFINRISQNDTGFVLGTIFAPIGFALWTTGEIAITALETEIAFGTGFFVAGQAADESGLFPKLWLSNYLNSL